MTGSTEGMTVVTGAASGMGLACARRLARAGAPMLLVDRDPAVHQMARVFGAEPAASGVDSFACDITDAGAVAELADPGMAYSWAKWGVRRLVEREAAR